MVEKCIIDEHKERKACQLGVKFDYQREHNNTSHKSLRCEFYRVFHTQKNNLTKRIIYSTDIRNLVVERRGREPYYLANIKIWRRKKDIETILSATYIKERRSDKETAYSL